MSFRIGYDFISSKNHFAENSKSKWREVQERFEEKRNKWNIDERALNPV